MFDLFSKKAAKEIAEDLKTSEPIREKTSDEQDWYRVGCTNDGRTTLTLLNGSVSMTLTMNEDRLRQLIKLLEATLPTHEE